MQCVMGGWVDAVCDGWTQCVITGWVDTVSSLAGWLQCMCDVPCALCEI